MTGATATSLSPIFAVSAPANRETLVVSVHDVAPETRPAVERIVAELARHRIPVCSLLVVPNYHRHGSFTDDPGFTRWLQNLEAQGNEIVIHGYFHQRPRQEKETARTRFLTRLYTNDEGEFYDLDFEEALRRVTQAKEEFARAGLSPRGFIAPAWLLGTEAERAVAEAELEYTTRLTGVRDLRSGDDFQARTLVYSVRSGWRRAISLAWNNILAQRLIRAPLARVSIHPPDCEHREVWQQILRLVDRLGENRTPTTYRDWLAEKRTGNGT